MLLGLCPRGSAVESGGERSGRYTVFFGSFAYRHSIFCNFNVCVEQLIFRIARHFDVGRSMVKIVGKMKASEREFLITRVDSETGLS
jgi:hypothetical protein